MTKTDTVPATEAAAFEAGCIRRDDTLRTLIADIRGLLDRVEAAEAARNGTDKEDA